MYAKKNDETNFVISRYGNQDELYHYGVPGMKWGKRKSSYSKVSTAIKSLSDPTTFIKKDGYQKSKNPIGTVISKDGYKKQKLPFGTRSVYSKEKSAKHTAKKSHKAVSKAYKNWKIRVLKIYRNRWAILRKILRSKKK